MNPFDLPGPQFLAFYAVLFLAALAGGTWLRWYLRLPGGEPGPEVLDLSPGEAAYLAGGEERAVNAAIARLVHEGSLAADTAERKLTRRSDAVPAGASELERVIHAAVPGETGTTVAAVRSQAAPALPALRNRLQDLEWLVAADRQGTAVFLPLLLVLAVPLLGVIKIFVGIDRHRPVGFLIFGCIVSVAVALVGFGRRVTRSRLGDKALAELKSANAALEFQAGRRAHELGGNDLTLAVGLFGTAILVGGPLSGLVTALKPPPSSGGSGSSCSSGGCGGGGCGGGCGGGGCGGCGG
jgi:uncharacterized protein (TIGR04222 family)